MDEAALGERGQEFGFRLKGGEHGGTSFEARDLG
jgi:hypothetical protein